MPELRLLQAGHAPTVARHGLRALMAATAHGNVASQKVLTKTGFVPADPSDLGGKPGTWYRRDLL